MKIIKKYNKNLKVRIDKELYLYNEVLNHNNAKFYGLVEKDNLIYTIYTENYGSLIIFNVVTWANTVQRNKCDDGYDIEYKRFTRSTGEDKKTLTDKTIKNTVNMLISDIENRIKNESKIIEV